MSVKFLRDFEDRLNRNRHIRRVKNLRNWIVDQEFRSRKSKAGNEFAAELRRSGVRNVCFAISFNTPWVIDILTAAWLRYSPGTQLVVIDNSNKDAARTEIKAICAHRGIPYFRLPKNREWSTHRSHGIAMNWIFYNIIRKLRPSSFGFIDHDCFPTKPVDFGSRLEGVLAWGLKMGPTKRKEPAVQRENNVVDPWFLWPGLCYFRYSAVEDIDLDFKHRFEWDLDTGGGNWPLLFKGMDQDQVHFAVEDSMPGVVDGLRHQLLDETFLHFGGTSWVRGRDTAENRRMFTDYFWDRYLDGVENRLCDL